MTQRALSSLWYDTVEVCALIFPENGKCQRIFSAMIAAGFSSERGNDRRFLCHARKIGACRCMMRKPDGIAVVFSITGGEDLPVFPADLMHKAGNGVTIWLQK